MSQQEVNLYAPFASWLENSWPKGDVLDRHLVQLTAQQGSRPTGGSWTRPDVILLSVQCFRFVPGTTLTVNTFEIKTLDDFDAKGVFEAAAHSAFSHNSYLAIHVSDFEPRVQEKERLVRECRRNNIGLILFTDPSNPSSYRVIFEPDRRNPDPVKANEFISIQISEENKKALLSAYYRANAISPSP